MEGYKQFVVKAFMIVLMAFLALLEAHKGNQFVAFVMLVAAKLVHSFRPPTLIIYTKYE